jgi:hypothetical protein
MPGRIARCTPSRSDRGANREALAVTRFVAAAVIGATAIVGGCVRSGGSNVPTAASKLDGRGTATTAASSIGTPSATGQPRTVTTSRWPRSASDSARDHAIGHSALITPEQLGTGWKQNPNPPADSTPPPPPPCADFVDTVYNLADEETSPYALFENSGGVYLQEAIFMLPTTQDASAYMDEITKATFPTCVNAYVDVQFKGIPFEHETTDSPLPKIQPHGDRQVVLLTTTTFKVPSTDILATATTLQRPPPSTYLIVIVQQGRAVVEVDMTPSPNDPGDPSGFFEKTLALALQLMADALARG